MKLRIFIKILTTIILCSNLNSCHGQVNNATISKEVNSSDSELSERKEKLRKTGDLSGFCKSNS